MRVHLNPDDNNPDPTFSRQLLTEKQLPSKMSLTKINIPDEKFQPSPDLNQVLIDCMNVPQGRAENKAFLDTLATDGLCGVDVLIRMVGLDVAFGLTPYQIERNREMFGTNAMPASPTTSYFMLLIGALSDTTLLILIAAACVSFAIGYWEDPKIGWIEGAAIFIAVFLVSNISAGNDYSKELQFRALEASSAQDQRASVFRDGQIELINPSELVVGDIFVLQVITNLFFVTSELLSVLVVLFPLKSTHSYIYQSIDC